MNCCVECFKDSEIRGIIESEKKYGKCDICSTENTLISGLTNDSLVENFQKLLDVYSPIGSISGTDVDSSKNLLVKILTEQWNIFNITEEQVKKFLINMFPEKYAEEPGLLENQVAIIGLFDPKYVDKYSILGSKKWEDFVSEIKTKNRFHTSIIKEHILEDVLKYTVKKYDVGSEFYRGRIWNNIEGFNKQHLGAPPSKKATAGRANPVGISCLYLANTKDTTLNETRAGVHDWISIGKFVLQENIEVIDLAMLDKISPFLVPDIDLLAANIEHLKKIGDEISRPLRRHDSTLDYLPTQFISDYIKSLGYHGIQYKSTMCADGVNLAIFDQHLLKCTEVENYDITGLKYNYKKKN